MSNGVEYNAITKKSRIISVDQEELVRQVINPTEAELLTAEIISLKERLAKVESTDTVKAELVALDPIIKEPIISK